MPLSDELMKVRRGGLAPAFPDPVGGLDFPANFATGGDIRLVFSGTNLVNRFNQTVIWKERPRAITGYQAVTWNSPNNGGWDNGLYSVGMHGHPCTDATVDGNGQRQNAGGPSGTRIFAEIAGLVLAADYISSPSSPGPQSTFEYVANTWYRRARIINPNGSNTEHWFYPDLTNRPTEFIFQPVTTSSIGTGGANPAFYFGASDWTPAGSANQECINGVIRGICIFAPAITNLTHITQIAAMENDADVITYCTSNGIMSSLWYLNMNPRPSDVTDKSGNARNPSWANSNRPSLYTA